MTTPATTSPSPASPVLTMRGIRKSFGGVEVLKGVDFDIRPGEVHALCGENGAGKSTLMNILAGVHRPDAGEIILEGRTFEGFESAYAAQRHGIGIVFQERSLFAPLTVAENIFAGRQPVTRWGVINRRRLEAEASDLLREIAPDVRVTDEVGTLSVARQQMVEIAKALSIEARIVVFDEPTAALTATETVRLFAAIRQLQARGVGIVYISHRLEEVFQLGNRVTVLKDGAWQGTLAVAATHPDELIRRMVGRDIEKPSISEGDPAAQVLLEVRGLSDALTGPAAGLLRDVSFQARAGEIVTLAGLAGAGRTEAALSLFGARPRGAGEVWLAGKRVEMNSPAAAIAAGLGYVSEDRKESGLYLDMSVRRNISAASLWRFGSWFFRDREELAVAEDLRSRLRVACRSVEQDTGHLSGGNQQKVLLARWLLVRPRVLIVDEPTRGVDVGAKVEVHQLLREFARSGHAVVMISSDLPEVLTLSDRVYVMRAGRIAGELPRADLTEEAILRLAAAAAANGRSN